MIKREYWIQKIEKFWQKQSIIWLAGVRRSGKTSLCKSIENIEYFDCELPSIRHQLEDPESFLKKYSGKQLVFDEIHNLANPSQILKIAADHFPKTKIIATGSSTLNITKKFKDSLTGRYQLLHLPPLLQAEGLLFGNADLTHRMLFGGLPNFFLQQELETVDFQSWLDSYWAKDIQELFRLEKRPSFLKFCELILAQSSGMFEASRFTDECEVSRATIANYLSILATTYFVHIVRPFSTHSSTEIKSAPKVYGFDTGFVCHTRGWYQLRESDYGPLWEHIVLNELVGRLQKQISLHYWRNKRGHEIDFIILKNRHTRPIAVECKWSYRTFNPQNISTFRRLYPDGKNYVVCANIDRSYERAYDDITVMFVSLEELIVELGRPELKRS
jgi:hypothetical protein